MLPNLHLLPFDQGRVQLMLGFGDVALLLPQIRAHVDAFFLDGYAPSHNPQMWQPRVIKGLARLAAPGATVATWSAASSLRADLVSAGFELHAASGIGGKRDITLGTYAPRYTPRDKPRRAAPAPVVGPPPQAIVIGAGLAGAWAAHALAQRGVTVTVLDRQPQPAAEASGNLAGIFHPTVHGDDGAHAQLLRAAALFAHQRMRPLIAAGLVPGQVDGLLRLVSGTVSGRDALRTMQAQVRALGLPEGYVQALSADQASVLAGVRLSHPAWYFAHAGWVAPAALVRQLLAAPSIRFVGGAQVRRLRRNHDGWAALDANGQVLAQAPVLVLANADGAGSLLTTLGHAPWPLQRWRGQVSVCETHDRGGAGAGTTLRLPVAGDGYALPLAPGTVLCGASAHEGDEEGALREHDHRYNFERLRRLTGITGMHADADADPTRWRGRVGWRMQVPDRLAIVGRVPLPPQEMNPTQRLDQARWVPRTAGLYVATALGGRGITLAPLLGELLAAQICAEALPVPADLVDAIDPARWLVQQARHR